VYCGSCKERVHIDLNVDDELLRAHGDDNEGDGEDDSFAISSEVYDSIVKKYQTMITTAHSESCLWRKRGCDSSIQRIEGLLNTAGAIASFRKRYENITTRPQELPEVASLPPDSYMNENELLELRFEEGGQLNINALRLAICGWDRKCEDVIECRHCFRSLGLWLYRGETPAMEKLDPIENHLQYCPWVSSESQDTAVILQQGERGDQTQVPSKTCVAGWWLVLQAVARANHKTRSPDKTALKPAASMAESVAVSGESLTPDQREKRVRDLFKRIKEIRKPFNVKSLLKRKSKKDELKQPSG
jgi:hypothetical protein